MRKTLISALMACVAVLTTAQNNEELLMTIGDTKVSKGEFEYIFNKNNTTSQEEFTTSKEYVDMFVKFKLKVIEAENRGLDTTKAFVDELAGYRSQLAQPYLIDQDLNEQLLKEAYFRFSNEINATHILIRLDNHPRPEDTLKAYNKAVDIRKKALAGASFEELAVQYSQDPSAKTNKGNLNYFSGFQMVFPFEDAAYNTPVGGISMPVRSSYGYHIIKVNDLRPSRGEVKVAHILYLRNPEMTPEKVAELKAKADNAYARIQANPSLFVEIATQESDDKASAQKNGELPWFGSGQMVFEFQEVAFNLKNNGDISEPFETQFGWHIIKKMDQRPVASFEEKQEELKRMLARTSRGRLPEESFINRLKTQYAFAEHKENVDTFIPISKKYRYNDSMFVAVTRGLNKPVITLDSVDVTFTQEDFADYLVTDPRSEVPDVKKRVETKWNRYTSKALKNYEESQLEENYPEFRYLMQEYHDGILLFEISQEEVWDKASIDTVGLEKYYKKKRKNYPYETEHFEGKIYYCQDDSILNMVKLMLDEKVADTLILDSLNKQAPLVNIEEGVFTPGQNTAVDSIVFAGTNNVGENLHFNAAFTVGKKHKAGVPKPLSSVRGAVISDYQDYLEQKWIKQLKKKYPVKVNKEVLETIEIKAQPSNED